MDYSKIKEDFIQIIRYSQKIEEPQVDQLFENWSKNKADIIKAFGGKLIYEIEEKISFELSDEARQEQIGNFIANCWDLGLDDLASFVDNEREGFFKNKCEKDYEHIQKGTKLVKAFKHFIKDDKILHEMQSKASQIIQEDKVEGKLCFSVHPLDYLSISENDHKWRSCHALDGEYRAGNLSYMMDNCTIVCYLKSETDCKLPRFPDNILWNNKKWRVLLYLSNDWKMIFAGKQYPFSTTDGMNMIVDKFFNIDLEQSYRKPINGYNYYKNCRWSPWTDYTLHSIKMNDIEFNYSQKYIPMDGGLIQLDQLVHDVEGSKHFNDVLHSSCYIPMYTFLVEKSWWKDKYLPVPHIDDTKFSIGASTYCLRCGKEEVMEGGASTMLCYDCEKDYGIAENEYFCFCHHCGRRIFTEESYYIYDETYCEKCADEVGARCESCGDYYLKEKMYYNNETDSYYCEWCNDND